VESFTSPRKVIDYLTSLATPSNSASLHSPVFQLEFPTHMDFKFLLNSILFEKQFENFFEKSEQTKLEISDLRIFMAGSSKVRPQLRKEVGLLRSVDKQGSTLRPFYQHKACNSRLQTDEHVNLQKLNYEFHYGEIIKVIKRKLAGTLAAVNFDENKSFLLNKQN
jgi:hypothetical protein